MPHVPVLLHEVIRVLSPKKGEFFVDGTFGSGGHSRAIAEAVAPGGMILGIDRDPERIRDAEGSRDFFEKLSVSLSLENVSYAEIPEVLRRHGFRAPDGILLDLGFSSMQIEDAARGFSFQENGPLDMRYDPNSGISAAEVVNTFGEEALRDIILTYGEEPAAGKIAESIVTRRRKNRILTTFELRDAVIAVKGFRKEGILHPATKTFQAIRVYVNDEIGNLKTFLSEFSKWISPGSRIAVISFQGIEDTAVKEAFRALVVSGQAKAITKKPIQAGEEELAENPRARSAKLRAISIQ